MRRFVVLVLAHVVLAVPLTLSACTTAKAGDCQDACSHQDELTFCDIDGVYPGTDVENECIAPPSVDACNRIESCPDGLVCTDDSMGVCVDCLASEDCDDGLSCSDSNTCVMDPADSCPGDEGDAACRASDPDLPRCSPDGICVACISDADCSDAGADASVCDEEDFECRGCIANGECESKLCGLETGVCASENGIVYVAKSGADGASCGTLGSPCLSIAAGLAQVTAERNTVLIGAGDYAEKVVLAFTVSLIGDGAVNINPVLGDSEAAVFASGPSDVHMDGIDIELPANGSSQTAALHCSSFSATKNLWFSRGTVSGPGSGVTGSDCAMTITESNISGNGHTGIFGQRGALSITRSTISGNGRSGIQVVGCALSVTRSTIADHTGSRGVGINIFNSDFEIINNIIVNNGSATTRNGAGGMVIRNSLEMMMQVLDFNTVAINRAGSSSGFNADASNVHCEVTTTMVASGNIIVGGQGETLQGTSLPNLFASNCSFEYSNIEDGPAGTGNIDADPLLVNPIAGTAGDFHLQPNSPCIDAADPAATVDIDVDGEARPQGGGHDMGADEAQ